MPEAESRTTLRLIVALALIAAAVVAVQTSQTRPAAAAPTPPGSAASYYVQDTDYSYMQNLGAADGRNHNYCGNWFVFLDFGQINYRAGEAYGGYGTDIFASGYPYVNDTIARGDAYYFAVGWNSATQACTQLTVAIGTNNYNECPNGGSCGPSPAGANWALMMRDSTNDMTNHGLASEITSVTADDIEGGYDSYYKTSQFVTSYNTHITTSNPLYDYGDAFTGNDWTTAHFYDVAYGQPYDYPFPETYYQSQIDAFVNVRRSYYMFFEGSLSEYSNGGNSPNAGWTALYDSLQNAGVGQSSIPFSADIVN